MRKREISLNQICKQLKSLTITLESLEQSPIRKECDVLLQQLLQIHEIANKREPLRFISKQSRREEIYLRYLILNNVASCYSLRKEIVKMCEFIKLIDKELKAVTNLILRSETNYQWKKIEMLGLQLKIIRIKLELCAVYALNGQHSESLYESSQAFGLISQVIGSMCDFSIGEKYHQDFLELQRLSNMCASTITYKDVCSYYWNNRIASEKQQNVKEIFLGIFEKNKVLTTRTRSILGKIVPAKHTKSEIVSNFSQKYLKEFSISSVMKICSLRLDYVCKEYKKEDYLNIQFFHELVVLLSLTHFTVATELRLGTLDEQENDHFDSENSKIKSDKKNNEAQRHHFYSIQIIFKLANPYLKQCPYFDRLLKGYEQIYILKDDIQIIPERVEEENEVTEMSIKIAKNQQIQIKEIIKTTRNKKRKEEIGGKTNKVVSPQQKQMISPKNKGSKSKEKEGNYRFERITSPNTRLNRNSIDVKPSGKS